MIIINSLIVGRFDQDAILKDISLYPSVHKMINNQNINCQYCLRNIQVNAKNHIISNMIYPLFEYGSLFAFIFYK